MPDDARLVQLDQQLCFKLYAASRLMTRAYRPLLALLDVTYPQYLVLMVLWESPEPVTLGDLGQRLLLDTGTLTPLVKRMESQGLLTRRRGRDDERQVWLQATQAGMALRPLAIDWLRRAKGALAGKLDVQGLKEQLGLLLSFLQP